MHRCYRLQLSVTDVATLMPGMHLTLGPKQVLPSFAFSALICTLCSPNSNSQLDQQLDTSCPPISPRESFALSTFVVSPIGTSLGITTPLGLFGLSEFSSISEARFKLNRVLSSRFGSSSDSNLTLFARRCSGCLPLLSLNCSTVLSCAVYSPHFLLPSVRVRAPPELLLGAPPTGLTGAAAGTAVANAACLS